jgi:hypothetical protein
MAISLCWCIKFAAGDSRRAWWNHNLGAIAVLRDRLVGGCAIIRTVRGGSVANFADRPSSLKLPATVSTDQQAMIEFKGSHFERAVILWAVRWYVAYPISYRQLEEMMEEHGVDVDHATLNRWVLKYVPLLEQELQARKQPVGSSWRMDETYVKVKGSWKYLYRAVDKAGATVDFRFCRKVPSPA